LLIKVVGHNGIYGRAAMPQALIGRIVEVIVHDVDKVEEFGNGEDPSPVFHRKRKPINIQVVSSEQAEAEKMQAAQAANDTTEATADNVVATEEKIE
jgi:hypothetical protein